MSGKGGAGSGRSMGAPGGCPEAPSASARERIMRKALEDIERDLPASHEEAEEVWANRRWAGEFRRLQCVARAALKAVDAL